MDGVWCKFRNAVTAGSQFRWVALDNCSLNLALENLMRAEFYGSLFVLRAQVGPCNFLQLCGVCLSFSRRQTWRSFCIHRKKAAFAHV